MAKRNSMTAQLQDLALVIAGQTIASRLDQIPAIGNNAMISAGAKLAVGLFVMPKVLKLNKGVYQPLAMGIALQGAKEVANTVLPGAINGASGIGMSLLSNASTAVNQVAGSATDSVYLD